MKSAILTTICTLLVPASLFATLVGFGVAVQIGFRDTGLHHWPFQYEIREWFRYYTETHNGRLPAPERWRDTLLSLDEIHEDDDSIYAFSMNRTAAARGNNVPEDMVYFFECIPGCDQVGGIEQLYTEPRRVGIIFGDFRFRLVRPEYAHHLRWNLLERETKPDIDVARPLTVAAVVVFVAFIILIWLFRREIGKNMNLVFAVGAPSAVIGYFGGNWGRAFYSNDLAFISMGIDTFGGAGAIAGTIAGFMAVVCHVSLMDKMSVGNKYIIYSLRREAMILGAIIGAGAAIIAHLFLMLRHIEDDSAILLSGTAFGLVPGMILGLIIHASMCRRQKALYAAVLKEKRTEPSP